MYPTIPLICPPPLQLPPKKEKNKNRGKKSISMEAVVCHVFNTQYILLSKQLYLQMIIAINLWFRLRTLVSATVSILDPHQNSSRLSCYCPVSWKSCSFGSAEPALHALQQFTDKMDTGVRQLRAKIWVWVQAGLAHSLSCTCATRASSSILLR